VEKNLRCGHGHGANRGFRALLFLEGFGRISQVKVGGYFAALAIFTP